MRCPRPVTLGAGLLAIIASTVPTPLWAGENPVQLTWHSNYTAAVEAAKEQGRMLCIFFQETGLSPARDAFEAHSLADPQVQALLQQYELVKLPLDASIRIEGQEAKLLEHSGFKEMLGRQGLAIVDYACPGTKHYGHVVSTFPFSPGKYYRPASLKTMLDLPAGTLTQRTMVFAVRTHPEQPSSTAGEFHPVLAEEAESHSRHQARIRVQGHHVWESRFHRIIGRLGFGSTAQEVVAESWPGENLVEAAVECVHSWRQSPGHWRAVRSGHAVYGYDMKRGSNGIWYATGIFANLRR